MKAIQVTKTDSGEFQVALADLPRPEAPKPGYVVVQVAASLINPSDRLNSRGGFVHTPFPRVPGRDFSGIIIDGPSARLGEHVFGSGGEALGFSMDGVHSEYCLVPEALAVTKPKSLTHLQAAVVGVPFTTAHLALIRARVTATDSVLVVGATGNVGSAAVQIAKAMGCRQVLTASRHDTSDVNLVSDPSFGKVKSLTGGKGVDVVINTVGDTTIMQGAFNALSVRGRFAFISSGGGPGQATNMNMELRQFYRNDWELIGCNTALQTVEEVGRSVRQLAAWFESGHLQAKPQSDGDLVSLAQASTDYQTAKKAKVIRIMDL